MFYAENIEMCNIGFTFEITVSYVLVHVFNLILQNLSLTQVK